MYDNYYSDPRVRALRKWYLSFDEKTMTAVVSIGDREIEVPCVYGVCPTCRGTGSHVNPSIDCNGITSSEMYELGDEFFEDYCGGTYDVTCYDCEGKRVVPVMLRSHMSPEDVAAYDKQREEDDRIDAECEAERRMGA